MPLDPLSAPPLPAEVAAAIAAGLIVLLDEEGLEVIPDRDGDPPGPPWLRVTFAVTLAHVSGATWTRSLRRTALVPLDGPAATGAAQELTLRRFLQGLLLGPRGRGPRRRSGAGAAPGPADAVGGRAEREQDENRTGRGGGS